MTKQELQHNILNQPYKREQWQAVLKRVFGATKLHIQPPAILLSANVIADSAVELGGFFTKDERQIGIYEIILKPDANTKIAINRVGLRDLLRNVYKYEVDAALIVFVQGSKWRFSYVSEIRTEEGKKETEPKRYTYLFGENEICRTAADRFSKLLDKKYYLQDLYDAFSVEKLNKDFFSEYKNFYKKGIEHIVSTKKYYDLLFDKRKEYNNNPDKQQKPIRDFVKKLLGRIVFLHFLQKKEWMGCPVLNTEKANENIWEDGSIQFMAELFKQFADKENFHSQCLQVLFLETLNTKRNNNISPFLFKDKKCRVPYLNGGLFDTDKMVKGIPIEALIDFPTDYFYKLFDFFEQYNFTIDENDPYDAEVGIDPEMLGHIFENLLEDNRERGAFYTPKDIVHYMCQESLIECIKSQVPSTLAKEDGVFAIETFVRHHTVNELFTTKYNAVAINTILTNLKVCDPAIGSGAFPMGMLKEIFECKRIIYPYLKTNEDFKPNQAKKDIIENNIYGVDIENGAVDIARLRFWLALVVDEIKPEPLPNLDYKIMQGNSLLEQFEGIDLKFEKKQYQVKVVKDIDLFGNVINPQVSITEFLQTKEASKEFDITELEHKYFKTSDPKEKQEIKEKISAFEKEFIQEQVSKQLELLNLKIEKATTFITEAESNKTTTNSQAKGTQAKYDNAIKSIERKKKEVETLQQELQRMQQKVKDLFDENNKNAKPYFLWRLYFMDVFANGGFDIVIGNPPYIQLQKMNEEINSLEKANFKTFSRISDIYCLFYEQGFNLLKTNGVLSYITSNTWMRTKFGELLRRYFKEETQPIVLLNFEDTKIFQTATVETNIIISKRKSMQYAFDAVAIKADYTIGTNILEYFKNNSIKISEPNDDGWIILEKNDFFIKSLIEFNGIVLKNWEIEFYRGMLTGFNDAFYIDEKKKNQLIREDSKSGEIIKRLIRGREIRRWAYEFNNNYAIYPHNGVKENKKRGNKALERIDVQKDYPAIYNHLLQYKDKDSPLVKKNEDGSYQTLVDRTDQGVHWTNIRDCAYILSLEEEKLVWLAITDKPAFAYDNMHTYVSNPSYFMSGKNLKYLLTILNSKVIEWYMDKITSSTGQGTNQWNKMYIEQLPVPKSDDKKLIKKFESLADYLIFLNDSNTPAVNTYAANVSVAPVFEDVANMMVYELYFKKHMQELELDILNEPEWDNYFKPIIDVKDQEQKAKIIGECYTWLQKQENTIRNKIILSNVKSKDIIRRINATTY